MDIDQDAKMWSSSECCEASVFLRKSHFLHVSRTPVYDTISGAFHLTGAACRSFAIHAVSLCVPEGIESSRARLGPRG